jgi:hypothetical protein
LHELDHPKWVAWTVPYCICRLVAA